MRSTFRAMTVALGFIAVAGLAGAQGAPQLKIGYVNTQALMEAAPGRAEEEGLLKIECDVFQAFVH